MSRLHLGWWSAVWPWPLTWNLSQNIHLLGATSESKQVGRGIRRRFGSIIVGIKLQTIRTLFVNSIHDTVKWLNSLNVFCFFRIWLWIRQHDPIRMKINKFNLVFKLKKLVVTGSSLHEFEMLLMRFSRKYLLHKFKKWRDDPEIINQKNYFSGDLGGLEIC